MKVLNRGFISVSPKPVFISEIFKDSETDRLTPSHPEPSIYLIEEDFWDDEVILKKYYKRIVDGETKQYGLENNGHQLDINFENIHDYFNISLGSMVFDLDHRPLEGLKDD
ncbi:hypothetical protein N9H88_00140 [bacterium]|jgi:hypothetical protein|nr:hypothetical protein [bacterium]MDC0460030.1 hypothetical protein [Crocinitomicaceae bacterium]